MSQRLLLIDVGNTRLKWALNDHEGLSFGLAFRSDLPGLEDRLEQFLGNLDPPEAIHVSCVRGELYEKQLKRWLTQTWGSPVLFARSQSQCHGLINGYRQADRLGVDRWVALLGVTLSHGTPVCLADCGTALTIDWVERGGQHRGGLIAPGIAAMRRALVNETGLSDRANRSPIVIEPARSTADGIELGIHLASAGVIEKAMREMSSARTDSVPLVLTGGDAERIAPLLKIDYRLDNHIVLRGLLALATHTP